MDEKKQTIRLTEIQREILESLRNGGMITVDRQNTAWLGDHEVQTNTRYFLTENGLITRLDKSRSLETKGNGFIISEKGLSILAAQAPRKKPITASTQDNKNEVRQIPATERQLAYAKDLGIDVPPGITKEEASDLISAQLDGDKPATDRHRIFADLYQVKYTRFIGEEALFDRIFLSLSKPTHETDLLSWFTFHVYRSLVQDAEDAPINRPDHPIIREIADQLASEDSVVRSIQRYKGRGLIRFGEWTSPDGTVYTGGSKRTVAFQRASSLLQQKLGIAAESSPEDTSTL